MAENFIEPSTASKTRSSSSKNYEYSSYRNDVVVSPYAGVVVEANDRVCGGNVVIKHEVGDEEIYSKLCGIKQINTLSGQRVRQGSIIGYFGDEVVNFSLMNEKGRNLNISDYILKIGSRKQGNKKTSSTTTTTRREEVRGNVDASKFITSLINLPAWGIQKLGQSAKIKKKSDKEKEEEQPNDIVFEEIQRIKKLMK